ncbi:hypothetical protein EU404_20275 [Salmonella enterica subsp. enterica serovar Weltevreden]|nr:hypothetical protein [Salmonella enterica subsp. enterica serovar Weltevreden]
MIEFLKALDAVGNLVFWLAFFVVLIKQPTLFNSLPSHLWWPMFLGMCVSGVAGILLWFSK